MEQQQDASGERPSPGQVDEIRDGSIDFTRYSLEQLHELRFALNKSAFPVSFANLLAELERRAAEPAAARLPGAYHELPLRAVTIRFTVHDGLRGWLEAKTRRLALYGEGFVEVRSQELVLAGWQRNWLGIAQRTEVFIPLHAISDVIQGDGGSVGNRREADWVRFRHETALGRYRFVEFQAGSIEQAGALVNALPKARSDGYERWTAVREFDARLREAGGRPWVTRAVVIANVAVFAVTALVMKRVELMGAPQLISWGANFAPLTLHGQWWRLLSALFLHGNLPHLLFNMWALWNVGRLTEGLYGKWAHAFLYFACGALSGLASIVWDPSRATLGASGAIFGIFAAFIIFSLHPRSRVAVKVPPALWISTLVFALYNLVAGFFTPGIDNAAHVGGAISGLVLGACLVQPLTAEARRRFPVKSMLAAAAAMAVGVIAAVWQASGLGDQLTAPERYLRTHLWYVNGEAESLREWQKIAVEAGSGQLSSIAVGERFKREIVPFWETASERLKKEGTSLPADERRYGALVAEYSRLRLEWARAVVDAAQASESRASDVTQYEKDSNLAVARSERVVLLASLDHRPRALANSPWVIAATNWLTGRSLKCVEAPPAMAKIPAAEDPRADGPTARRAAGCRAQKLLMSGDYLTLDHWMQRSAASLGDLPDGGSTLDGIVRGFSDLFDYQPLDVVQTLGRTADWRRRVPDSVYPELIQSLIFRSWAWAGRGHGYANSISPQAWAMFAQRTEMAAMGLSEVVERANTNPLWYQLSLDVGLDQSKTVDELRSIFNRGVVEQRDYWPLYTRMLRILMPRWLGSQDDISRFIREVSVRPNGERDFAKYARLYWSYSSLENDDATLFGGPLAVWSTMREGFMELLREHPNSDFILNAYAKFACMADDAVSYGAVRPKLRDRLSSVAWSDKVSLKDCDERFPAAAAAARGHTFTPPKFRLR
jgi:membrane associated rhomboid family serine protease